MRKRFSSYTCAKRLVRQKTIPHQALDIQLVNAGEQPANVKCENG